MLNLEVIFDLDKKETQHAILEQKMVAPDFWDDRENAQKIINEANTLKNWIDRWKNLARRQTDLKDLFDLADSENDEETIKELDKEIDQFVSDVDELETAIMLDDPDDHLDAILTIHPGAGGTESQDWASMLMRMYLRWIDRKKYESTILDFQPGEEAGIKSVSIEIKGENAYGYLKAEAGVHRLVRISPFDANKRRHTSFVSIFVYPEIGDDMTEFDIEINENDLKIDTYRASGAGGQHINKTDSAVRITHLPTGIVVQCQNERSQHKNKHTAMKILRSRLYQLHREEKEAEKNKLDAQKKKIEWGSQIRSYVFQPYTLVKDHRTNVEVGNINAVMDGDIDTFIHAYLKEFSQHTADKK